MRSDLTGRDLEAKTAATVRVAFADGRTRWLTVHTDEAEQLTEGRAVSSPRIRALWFGRKALKPLVWLLGLLIASLALPAITKQWSDRQQELDLKRTLVTELATATYSSYLGAYNVVVVNKAQPKRQRNMEARRRHKAAAQAWVRAQAPIDSLIVVYFPGSDLANYWSAYRFAFQRYIRAACCDSRRRADLTFLLKYLHLIKYLQTTRSNNTVYYKTALYKGLDSKYYPEAYDWLGIQIVGARPLGAILDAKPRGFSRGFGDFIHDLNPF